MHRKRFKLTIDSPVTTSKLNTLEASVVPAAHTHMAALYSGPGQPVPDMQEHQQQLKPALVLSEPQSILRNGIHIRIRDTHYKQQLTCPEDSRNLDIHIRHMELRMVLRMLHCHSKELSMA